MDKGFEIVKAKELRGVIVCTLYDFYGEAIALNTIRNMLRYKAYYNDKDIKRAVCYLSKSKEAYIHIENNKDDYWDSLVQLTSMGVNLAEGDKTDAGVLIDE